VLYPQTAPDTDAGFTLSRAACERAALAAIRGGDEKFDSINENGDTAWEA